MADNTQIKNPSLLPGDLNIQLSGDAITAISGHPLIGTGGGTQSDYVYYPTFNDETGDVLFQLGTTAQNPQPAGGWHISGATGPQGEQGVQGEQGEPGRNPIFQINPSNAHWEWKYADASSGYTDLGIVASGTIGPQGPQGTSGTNGKDGKDGENGISPTVTTATIIGGNRVIFNYGESQSTYIDVMSGISGAKGNDGFSPAITLEPATSTSYPNGGTKVTITDLEHQAGQEFYVWNGNDGQGATVNLLEGSGIKIDKTGQDYTIAVSANYSAMAVNWVQDQHYLTNIPNTYALKTDVEAASANAYNEAVAKIPDVTNFITKDVNNLTYYYKKTETSGATEISTELGKKVNLPTSQQTGKLVYNATNNTWEAAPTEFDGVVTAGSLSGNGTTNSPLGLKTSAEQALVAVDGKVSKPADSQGHNYFLWDSMSSLQNHWSNANSFMEGWASTWLFDDTDPIVAGVNGLSAGIFTGQLLDVYKVGIDTTNMAANKQYAFTTTGWNEINTLNLPLNIYSTATNTVSNDSIGAIGNNCVVGQKSFAMSTKRANASGNAFAFGDDNVAYDCSLAFGWGTTATEYSFAGGRSLSANDHSVALGNGNIASIYSMSIGNGNNTNYRSYAFGDANTATYWSVAAGRGLAIQGSTNASTGFGGLVIGGWNKTSADALFVAGNGTSNGNSRSDAAVLTKQGVWSATDFHTFTGNNKLSEKVSTTDSPHGSNLKAELAVIAFSDNEIVSFVTGGGCSGKGTLIFRVG